MESSENKEKAQHSFDSSEQSCWGWLEPSCVLLPYVSLRGKGSAIGRGKETFEERVRSGEQPNGNAWTSQLFNGRNKGNVQYEGLDFVEVADGRVSRMHCVVVRRRTVKGFEAFLEDSSTNGTFINNGKVGKGKSIALKDQDKISLVMSVAPMSEKYFIYHKGCPTMQDYEKFNPRNEALAAQEDERPTSHSSLSKWPTCKYTTADRCTLEDFQCQICLNTLSSCVTIEPCGHNFCAACLSKYLTNQLENGMQLLCPLRCPDPKRVVKNDTVRELVETKMRESGKAALTTDEEVVEQFIEDELLLMSSVCPLFDDQLPLEAKSLKTRQVEMAMQKLSMEGVSLSDKNHCLEVLARLCWSDDGARKKVTDASGINLIKMTMEGTMDNEAVQCNACLALMALVRGEGSVCQCSQWEIARSGTVEVIGRAMRKYLYNPMVQLSAMLCFIPLALDNPMMQAHLTQAVLSDILRALDVHQQEADVQCKGLIVLGILAQGEDCLHDAICIRQMESGMTRRIISALEKYGSANEEVFWGALFALATLAREGSSRFNIVCRRLSRNGVLRLLASVLKSYEDQMRASHQPADETIVAAGHYLILAISEAGRSIRNEWRTLILSGVGLGLLVGSVCAFVTLKKRGS